MITIDGVVYDLPIESVTRSFTKDYKYSVMTEDGKKHNEIRAVYVNYTVVFGGLNTQQYNALIDAVHRPASSFTAELPYNDDMVSLECDITLSEDYILLENDTERIWDGLSVTFESITPMEVVE